METQVAQVQEVEFLTAETIMTKVQEVMFSTLVQHYYQEEAEKAFQLRYQELMFVAKVKALMMGLM